MINQDSEIAKRRFPVGPLFLLTGIFYISFLARVIFSPIMPEVEQDLGVSHGGAGSLFLLVSLGYAISTLTSSIISSRITHNRIILLSSITAGLALLFISVNSELRGIQLGMIAVGLATGLYLPSAIATITDITRSEQWGRGIGVHELATALAFFSAPLIAEIFLARLGWRLGLAVIGVLSIVVGTMYFFYKGGRFVGESPTSGSLRLLLSRPTLWIMILIFILGIGGNFGVYSIMPLYLVAEQGMERESANTIVSLSRPIGILVVFFAGWASDRFGHWKTLSSVLIGSGLLIILIGVLRGAWLLPMILIQPLFAVAFFPAALAALSGMSSRRDRSLIISITTATAILVGTGVIPTGLGLLGDLGKFSVGISLLGSCILIGGILIALNQTNLARLKYDN